MHIPVPSLVIVGAMDAAAAPTATEMVNLLPAGQLEVIESAGHFTWVENPSSYATAIERFLRENAASG